MSTDPPAITRRSLLLGLTGLAATYTLAGCGGSPSGNSATATNSDGSANTTPSPGKLSIVAGENFWGSIASQLGGDLVTVSSIITNPDTDPHDYEPTPNDARTVADARYVIVNGAGYDPWLTKLLNANPVNGRKVLNVGELVGKKGGDNPHLWYNPDFVSAVIDHVTTDLATIASDNQISFKQQKSVFTTTTLKPYHDTISAIKQSYRGTKVGSTESIFVYMATALGLDLISPPGFMQAISEGNDVTAADKATFDEQVTQKQIAVLVYNSQNSTPDTEAIKQKATDSGIPVVAVTETLAPASATFEAWQTDQLTAFATGARQGYREVSAGVDHIASTGVGRSSTDSFSSADARMHEPIIELVHASASVGGRTLWHDLNLSVRPGEFIAVLGPNGAGKSTMLKLILGLTPLSSGSIRVLGEAGRGGSQHVGYVPQRHTFDADTRIRGRDLVELGLSGTRWGLPLPGIRGLWGGRRTALAEQERVREVVELVGASSYADRPIGELSGGEQQRLLIAQALVTRPRVLLLDEPLDSLDLTSQQAVSALIHRIGEELQVAVLLVAHDVNAILPYLDRVLYIARGHTVIGTPDEVMSEATLSQLYGTPIEVLRTRDGRIVVVGQPEGVSYHGHGAPHDHE